MNKVVIITGASRGLGGELALKLGNENTRLVVCARNEKELIAVKKNIKSPSIIVKADVSKQQDVQNLFSKTIAKFGRVEKIFE